jgi:hypothetical protein
MPDRVIELLVPEHESDLGPRSAGMYGWMEMWLLRTSP